MRRISAGTTIFSKRVFPLLWVGVLSAVAIGGEVEGKSSDNPWFFVGLIAMLAFGLLLWWLLASDLADDVIDMGEYLVVRRGTLEDKIYFKNIVNIDISTNVNPQRMTIRLAQPSRFGRLVSFSPKSAPSINPFAANPLVEELVTRAHQARAQGVEVEPPVA